MGAQTGVNVMAKAPNWTSEDISYLQENWGLVSMAGICKTLRRSENAIKVKAQRLGLGAFLESGDYVTLNQIFIAATGSKDSYSYKTTSWVKVRGLPIHNRKVNNNSFKVVFLKEFWKWAEQNKNFLDFSKMEENALGIEPAWVKVQRKLHFEQKQQYITTPWTPLEDSRLSLLLKQHKYTYAELSKMVNRTCGAIQRRCCDLGLKERPLKADNTIKWTDAELELLASCIREGMGYERIADKIGKSSKALRGKIYAVYLTENIDKVRKMIGSGCWGYGAPLPTVGQAKRKANVKRDVSQLLRLLSLRRNELGWSAYWQKDMCENWNDITGCTASAQNCDDCISFVRIKPQYCARCGTTFFERVKNTICLRCRNARKKQYMRRQRRHYGRDEDEGNLTEKKG